MQNTNKNTTMTQNMIAVLNAVKGRTQYHKSSQPGFVFVNKFGIFVQLYHTIIYAEVRGRKYFSDGGWNTRMTSRYIKMLGGVEYSINKCKNKFQLRTKDEMFNLRIYGTLKRK